VTRFSPIIRQLTPFVEIIKPLIGQIDRLSCCFFGGRRAPFGRARRHDKYERQQNAAKVATHRGSPAAA